MTKDVIRITRLSTKDTLYISSQIFPYFEKGKRVIKNVSPFIVSYQGDFEIFMGDLENNLRKRLGIKENSLAVYDKVEHFPEKKKASLKLCVIKEEIPEDLTGKLSTETFDLIIKHFGMEEFSNIPNIPTVEDSADGEVSSQHVLGSSLGKQEKLNEDLKYVSIEDIV